ncbi:response regulator [Dyadobacter sp. NIV53]|uniref:response regulator n=1 Tax=Dyadobacter sp. NIV53 TaxID=2861765 RepID=UPI001C8759A0|nr:response regulator [Dyadobacter sp. NIV53]
MKIYVIDDEWICRFLTQKLIQKTVANSDIILFCNGQEAIEFMKQHLDILTLPELILLDINMPVANGWKFLEMMQALQIKDYYPSIYIVSSSLDPDDIAKAQTYTAVLGYLPKPLTVMILTPVLEAALHNSALLPIN